MNMKYIIAENKLDTLIDYYITQITGGSLEMHKHPSTIIDYIWWTDLNNIVVFEADKDEEGFSLGVREDIWNSVHRMFSLSSYDTDKSFLAWMSNRTKIKFPGGVYTFEV